MALYAIIEMENGDEMRIDFLNGERLPIDNYILSMEVHREWIHRRDQLRERRYRGGDIESVIQNLRKGDVVRISPEPKSYRDRILTIGRGGDDAHGIDEKGDEYLLIPVYWGSRNQGDGRSWMRTRDGDSRGAIEEIEILELC